jgi:hypothetical protein
MMFQGEVLWVWCRVVLYDTNISEVHAASIFWVKQGFNSVFIYVYNPTTKCNLAHGILGSCADGCRIESSIRKKPCDSLKGEPLYLRLHPEDGGSMELRNAGILPQHYTASRPIWPRLKIETNNQTNKPSCVCQHLSVPLIPMTIPYYYGSSVTCPWGIERPVVVCEVLKQWWLENRCWK